MEFLLVPTVGGCILTLTPPTNQLIHVVYPEEIEIRGFYESAWATGIVEADQSVQNVRRADGQSRVEVSYRIKAARIDPY